MSSEDEYFEVIANYSGKDGDSSYLPVRKGDIVRVLKKEPRYFTVDKDGEIGKVPKGKLREWTFAPTEEETQEQNTSQTAPDTKISSNVEQSAVQSSSDVSNDFFSMGYNFPSIKTTETTTTTTENQQQSEIKFDLPQQQEEKQVVVQQTEITEQQTIKIDEQVVVEVDKSKEFEVIEDFQEQSAVLSQPIKISSEQLNQIKEIQTIIEAGISPQDLIQKLKDNLQAVRSVQTFKENDSTDEMIKISKEITEKVAVNIKKQISQAENIEFAFQTGLVAELVDLTRRTPVNEITQALIDPIRIISSRGTAEQVHRLFELNTIQSLTPKLKISNNQVIQDIILEIFVNIIKSGWKQQQIQSPAIKSRKQGQSQQEEGQNKLQQILNRSHPYLTSLEDQGVIRKIIGVVLLNKDIKIPIKSRACEFLDAIYIEGAKIPSDLLNSIIANLCESVNVKHDYDVRVAFKSLGYVVLNQENFDAIVTGDLIDSTLNQFKKLAQGQNIHKNLIQSCLKILGQIYIYSIPTARNMIRSEITSEIFEKLISNKDYEEDAKILKATFRDPQTVESLIRMKRPIELRNNDYKNELIYNGIIDILINEIDQAINKDDDEVRDGLMSYIYKILHTLISENPEGSKIVVQQTDFVERQLNLLNALPAALIKIQYLSPLNSLLNSLTVELNHHLYSQGIIQVMIKIYESEDVNVKKKAIDIITKIISSGMEGAKEQEQHPYLQQLSEDGTIERLVQIIREQNQQTINISILVARGISKLFKAAAIPEDFIGEVVGILKENKKFEEIALLAECGDNHEQILLNDFEDDLFKEDQFTLDYLRITLSLLQLGNDTNKTKVALAVKSPVNKLVEAENVNQIGQKVQFKWNKEKKDEIVAKANEIVPLIQIEEEKEQQREIERQIEKEKQRLIELEKEKEALKANEQNPLLIKDGDKSKDQEKEKEQDKEQDKEKDHEKESEQVKDLKSSKSQKELKKEKEKEKQKEKELKKEKEKELKKLKESKSKLKLLAPLPPAPIEDDLWIQQESVPKVKQVPPLPPPPIEDVNWEKKE